MKHENPCFDCPDNGHKGGQGCGKHATCEREEILSNYTKDAVERVKSGAKSNLKKYRPKEGK